MGIRQWSLALAAVFGAWLCWHFVEHEPLAAPDVAELVTLAQHKTRLRHGLIKNLERNQIEGRVLNGERGVADALVCASCLACEATTAPTAPCVRSRGDGAYAFSDLAVGGYFIAASAVGYASGAAHGGAPVYVHDDAVLSGIDIALTTAGARVKGSVVDATGGPIAHALVRAIRLQPPRLSLDLVSDDEGHFELWVQPGFIAFSAEAEGYARASQRATAPTEVELRLVPGSSIEGVVLDAHTRRPVAAVDVRAAPPENPQLAMARGALSDDGGRFRIDGLEPGAYLLSARAERKLGMPAQSIELGIGEQRSGIVVEVTQAADVSGRVLIVGEDLPCQHGLVALGQRSPLDPAPSAEELARVGATLQSLSGSVGPEQVADIQLDGSVHFPGVAAGFYFVNVQCASRRLELGPRLLHVSTEPLVNLEWRVAKGGELSVRVCDERGAAISEMQVIVEHPTTASHVVSALETDADGRCSLDGLAPGTYSAFVVGQRAETLVTVEVTTAAKAETTLRLANSAMIEVEISDHAGRPVDGLSLQATQRASAPPEPTRDAVSWTALALGAGRYRLGPLPGGSYAITADDGVNPALAPDNTAGAIVVAAVGRTTRTRIVLARAGAISGKVVDGNHAPLADVWVSAKPHLNMRDRGSLHTFGLAEARQQRVLTDREGRFTLGNLASDAQFDVRALTPYGSATVRRAVRTGAELVIELPEPASISGVALDDAGRPVVQLTATAISRDADSKQTRMFFDPAGRFSLPSVAPGSVELSLVSADGRRVDSTLEVAAGQRVTGLFVTLAAAP